MRSRHRKQREWRRKTDEVIRKLETEKGVTVGAVHPSENHTPNDESKVNGVTVGKIPQRNQFVNMRPR